MESLGNLFTPGKTGALYELVDAELIKMSDRDEFATMIDVLTDSECCGDCNIWYSGQYKKVVTDNYYAAQAWGKNRRLENTLAEIHGVPKGELIYWDEALIKGGHTVSLFYLISFQVTILFLFTSHDIILKLLPSASI